LNWGIFRGKHKIHRYFPLRDVKQRHNSLPFSIRNTSLLQMISAQWSNILYQDLTHEMKKTLLDLNIQLLFRFTIILQRYDFWHYAMHFKWIVKFRRAPWPQFYSFISLKTFWYTGIYLKFLSKLCKFTVKTCLPNLVTIRRQIN
jgi:hypothetical protein